MTMRLLGIVGAVAIAMALDPTSFGLTGPQAKPAGESIEGAMSTPGVSDAKPAVPAPALPQPRGAAESDRTAVPGSGPSATLSMVPKSPKLVRQISDMLPADLTVEQAAVGFRNQGQFIATVQVSRNLGIPFPLLKKEIVGEGMSLGQAIYALKPEANVSRELARVRDLTAQDQ